MRCPRLDVLPPCGEKKGWPWSVEPEPIPERMADGSPWPRISIVTPSYNQGQFLEEAIRSVLLQGYPNLEYIIIDGGSTDESIDIIRKYQPWLAHWVSERDRGQSHAINKGWQGATGGILAWLNSDDYYAPGALVSVATRFSHADAGVGVIYGRANCLSNGCVCESDMCGLFDLEDVLRRARAPVPQPSAFVRADAARRVNGLDEQLHMALDWDLWVRIAVENELLFVPEVWSYMRLWPGCKTRSVASGFGPDLFRSVRRLFETPGLPPRIQRLKNTALAAAALESSRNCLRFRRYIEMQVWFLYAFLRAPAHTFRIAEPYERLRLPLGPLFPLLSMGSKALRQVGMR